MRLVHSITEQLQEIRELWCKFRGGCEVEPAKDDRIDWLRDQQVQSQRQRTGNWQVDQYRGISAPREERGHG